MATGKDKPGKWLEEYWYIVQREARQAKEYYCNYDDLDDLKHAALLAMVDAAAEWDGEHPFGCVATWHIRNCLRTAYRKLRPQILRIGVFAENLAHPCPGGLSTSWPLKWPTLVKPIYRRKLKLQARLPWKLGSGS